MEKRERLVLAVAWRPDGSFRVLEGEERERVIFGRNAHVWASGSLAIYGVREAAKREEPANESG